MMTQKYIKNVKKTIKTFVEEIKTRDGLVGIMILGGLGKKKYFDEFSDVDIAVFINSESDAYPDWLPEFEFAIFVEDAQKINFNVHQQNLKKERSAYWDDTKKDAYNNGIILHEKKNILSDFLKKKLEIKKHEYRRKLMSQYVKIPPSCLLNPNKQLSRGEIGLSHQIINNGIENLIDLLFIINEKFIPHYKWKLLKSFELAYKPNNFHKNIHEAMLICSFTNADVKRRMSVVETISKELMAKVESMLSLNEESIYQICCSESLNRQLLETPFGMQVKKVLSKNRSVTNMQVQKIAGLINLHTVNNYKVLREILDSGLIFNEKEKEILLDLI